MSKRMQRREFLRAAGAAVVVAGATRAGAADVRPHRPNVILVLTDDQGYADMSCHGNPFVRTPNIDALHDESARLADFHVSPTCSPTRAGLLTGRYPARAGVWLTYAGRNHLRADETTLARAFADNDYRTGVFGKWHLGDSYPYRPEHRGFHEALVHGGGVVGETPDYWGNDYYDDTYFRNGKPEKFNGYCTDVWFAEAMKFIEKNRTRPFFVYLPTNAPHGPQNVPWKYVKPFIDDKRINVNQARFYGMIANIDENLGRLRHRLEQLGLAENTILIFMTDNGGTTGARLFNAQMRGRKGTAYEGGHRAACFVHWPAGGLKTGADIRPVTSHVDIMPTLVSLCRLEMPPQAKQFDGRSLQAQLLSPDAPWPGRMLFVQHQGRFGEDLTDDRPIKYKDFAVMTDRWRMVGDGKNKRELYDIRKDPGQKNDLSGRFPDVVERLGAAYEKWWADISERFDEYCRVVVGHHKAPRTVLTCQGWHGPKAPYSQQHVRAAVETNGFWALRAARNGVYEITLRRWPEELDRSFGAKVEPAELDRQKHDTNFRLYGLPSRAIRPTAARLKAGDFDETKKISPHDKSVTFEVKLRAGNVNLRTWLTDVDGTSRGAYYVYVRRKPSER